MATARADLESVIKQEGPNNLLENPIQVPAACTAIETMEGENANGSIKRKIGLLQGKTGVPCKRLKAINDFFDSKIEAVHSEGDKIDAALAEARVHLKAPKFNASKFVDAMNRAHDHQLEMMNQFVSSMQGPSDDDNDETK